MSFASKVLYTGDAVTTDFNVPMPYIARTDVNVYVNEILQLTSMNYTWTGPSTVSFGSAPNSGDAIEIRRWTSPTATLVDFVDGSVLNANDLDTAYLHTFYLSQEYADSFNEVINAMLVQVATAEGIEATEPDQVILELVASMIDSAAAANLQARISDIDDNAEAIITLGEGLQVQINTLAQGVSADVYIVDEEPVPGVGGVPNPILEGSRWYDSDDNNAPYIYLSGVWTSIADPRVGDADAAIDILQADYNNIYSAIVNEQFVRSTETTGLAQTMNLIGVQSVNGQAFIVDLDTTKISETESLADRFVTMEALWDAGDTTLAASIVTEASVAADATSAVASTVSLMGVENGGGTAFILDEDTVKIASDGGDTVAERFSALVAADGVNSSAISTIQSVTIPGVETDVADLEARYGVSLNVNGYISGFVQNNDGSSAEFIILADKFAIVDPSGDPGETEYVPFEISGGQINLRSDVKIDGDLIVTGTINGGALINGTIGSTQIGANSISTTHISALTIVAGDIAANAIEADKINVTNLAAINADIGSITAGNITLDTSGYIKGGQTAFDTGTGFFLGYESGAYKFSIGNQTDFIKWDGSSLIVRGNVSVGAYTASDTAMLAATTERNSGTISQTELKKFEINRPGTVRVSLKHRMSSVSPSVTSGGTSMIYLDGVLKKTWTTTSSSYSAELDYDLTVGESAQYITIESKYGRTGGGEPLERATYLKDCYVTADKSDGESVITD